MKKTYLDVLALRDIFLAHFDLVVLFAHRRRTEDIITQGIRMKRSDVVSAYEYSYTFLPGTPKRKLKPPKWNGKELSLHKVNYALQLKAQNSGKRKKNQYMVCLINS